MKIAVHQPNYLPWVGYFRKIALCNKFVFYDDVQFEKGGFTNRVAIRMHESANWLTQPIVKHGVLGSTIADIRFAADCAWKTKHSKTIAQNYSRCSHFSDLASLLETIYASCTDSLAEFNSLAISTICNAIGIETMLVRSSTIDYVRDAGPSEKLASLCSILGGDVYISGNGGRTYNDTKVFDAYKVSVRYDQWTPMLYPQQGCHIGGLSIIDLIANVGVANCLAYLTVKT
jgi:hypothetical protein